MCWPILPSARILMTYCEPSVRRRRRPRGFSNIIRRPPDLRRVFQHGIHVERSAAHLLSGLGNVAGDQLKAASDLGVPVVGVGLLYQQGYFRQVIDKDGAQQALYPYNDPGQLPITPVRQANGEWLRLEIALPGYSVWLRAWQVQVGRVSFTCWTAMTRRTFLRIAGSPASCMVAGRSCASSRKCCLGLAGGGCSARWASSQKFVT